MSEIVYGWFIFGAILMVLEFFLPGLVSVFLGLAACGVALGLYWGVIQGWVESITIWFVLSLFLVLTLRQIAARFLPSEVEVVHTDDDVEAIGTTVLVVDKVYPDNYQGRVRYHGTNWPARSELGEIEKGKKAIIRYRENIAWVVSPTVEEEA